MKGGGTSKIAACSGKRRGVLICIACYDVDDGPQLRKATKEAATGS
jgi:hypothetical protein